MIDRLQENGLAFIGAYLLHFDMIQFLNSSPKGSSPVDKALDKVLFIKDTGATVSTISRKSLLDLGYTHKYIDKNLIIAQSASPAVGKVDVGRIEIPLFQIIGIEFRYFSFLVVTNHEFKKKRDLPNLLGLDFGRYFNYREIFENWEFEITPTKPKNGLLLDNENQSINFLD